MGWVTRGAFGTSSVRSLRQVGLQPQAGMEHPETSWAALAGAWLEFCTSLGKNARYRTKTNSVPSPCGDGPFAVLEQMAKQVT